MFTLISGSSLTGKWGTVEYREEVRCFLNRPGSSAVSLTAASRLPALSSEPESQEMSAGVRALSPSSVCGVQVYYTWTSLFHFLRCFV